MKTVASVKANSISFDNHTHTHTHKQQKTFQQTSALNGTPGQSSGARSRGGAVMFFMLNLCSHIIHVPAGGAGVNKSHKSNFRPDRRPVGFRPERW